MRKSRLFTRTHATITALSFEQGRVFFFWAQGSICDRSSEFISLDVAKMQEIYCDLNAALACRE